MQLINATERPAGYTTATRPDGRESIVVVVKQTYTIPADPAAEPEPAEEQAPLVQTDAFTGEPDSSPPLYEIDYAPRKPRCDVVLNGTAYAPRGVPAARVTVSLRVAGMVKSFEVVGPRVWNRGVVLVTPSEPRPFTALPVSYACAFGGVDRSPQDPAKHRWYTPNPVGVGYHEHLNPEAVDGTPLPNTEEAGRRVTDPRGKYRPMAFGPVGRSWPPRIRWAGTYDQKWLDEKFPFLPDDFDERYYQCAPEDQQTDHLRGGEAVELVNLTPQGRTAFRLPPDLTLPVVFDTRTGESHEVHAAADTLVIEPDSNRFMIVWRASFPFRRTVREVLRVTAGLTAGELTRRAERERRQSGKQRYASLAEAARARRPGGRG